MQVRPTLSSEILFTLKQKKMENKEFKGNWIKTKGRLLKKFALLAGNDLLLEEGKKEEILGRLQIRLGKTKAELTKIIAGL
jgi:uncharacterized protein YjbJ (UPF0337 family)